MKILFAWRRKPSIPNSNRIAYVRPSLYELKTNSNTHNAQVERYNVYEGWSLHFRETYYSRMYCNYRIENPFLAMAMLDKHLLSLCYKLVDDKEAEERYKLLL